MPEENTKLPDYLVRLADLTEQARLDLIERYSDPVGSLKFNVPTGILSLDSKIDGGLKRGNITCLGAQSGHGKTTLGLQFARYAAGCYPDECIVFISPEMKRSDIAQMEVVTHTGHSRSWIKSHPEELKRPHMQRLLDEGTPRNLLLMNLPVLDDEPVLDEIAGRLNLLHASWPIALVVVDYAQYMIGELDTGRKKRFALAGDVVRTFNLVAERFDCAVLMTSQVNVRKEKGKIVEMTMRESALFEHTSATVLHYVRTFDERNRETEAYFDVTKNRYGSLGRLPVSTKPGVYCVTDESCEPEKL